MIADTAKRHSPLQGQVDTALDDLGMPPLYQLLTAIAAGFDPRLGNSAVRTMVDDIGPRRPSQGQWDALRELIESTDNGDPVDLEMSLKAIQLLTKYCYAAPKAKDRGELTTVVRTEPLTPSEVDAFDQQFNEEW